MCIHYILLYDHVLILSNLSQALRVFCQLSAIHTNVPLSDLSTLSIHLKFALLSILLLFIKSTEPINTTAKAVRVELWRERPKPVDASVHLNISADKHLPAGAENPWTTWKALNRLRTQVGRSRVKHPKVGIFKRNRDL